MNTGSTTGIASLEGAVQNYSWGVHGAKSLVASAHRNNVAALGKEFTIDEFKPYAELWFGNHPSAPSTVHDINVDQPIDQWLTDCRIEMPYLFKVLSIQQPLSLQLHPDEVNARLLHKDDPVHYPDPYDKPEMALALSQSFEVFCGFRRHEEILMLAHEFPTFGLLLRNDSGGLASEDESALLKAMMAKLYSLPQEKVKEMIDDVLGMSEEELARPSLSDATTHIDMRRVEACFADHRDAAEARNLVHGLFKRLHAQYQYDRGCFAAFFLNYLVLKAGEAVFLAPNTIHAYIRGNCLEVMRCSDNVIRAGLTPKFQDVERLLGLVVYKGMSPSSPRIFPQDIDTNFTGTNDKSHLKVYAPAECRYFRAYVLHLAPNAKALGIKLPQWGPIIVLGISGKMELIHRSTTDVESKRTISPGIAFVLSGWESLSCIHLDSTENNLVDSDSSIFPIGHGGSTIVFIMPNVQPQAVRASVNEQ